MSSYTHTHLKGIVDDLERYSGKDAMGDLKTDVVSIITEVLSFLTRNIDIPDLESRAMTLASVDRNSLNAVVKAITDISKNSSCVPLPHRNINPTQSMKEFKKFVDSIVSQAPLLESIDLIIKLDMVGNRIFDELLLCAAQNNVSVESIKRMVMEKLDNVSDDVVFSIWDRILGEFDQGRRTEPIIQDNKVMKPEFLKLSDTKRTREKIAEYIVLLKPRLLLSMFRQGIYSHPVEVPGAIRILALINNDIASSISEWEVMLARSISRLAYFWQYVLYEDIGVIANLLRVSKKGRLLSGPEFKKAEEDMKKVSANKGGPGLFWELRKILRVADSIVLSETPIERSLLQYKLGLEVMMPELLKEIEQKDESLLQKELCKFLIERNIFAVGTKFGRSETDLLAEDSIISYIIETKVYNPDDRLSEALLRKHLAQLQSYMDQSPTQRRGVLAIYNMTDCLLEAPRKWLHSRYWILAINLQKEPPSRRKRTITVEQSDNANLIRVERNEALKSDLPHQ